MKLWSWQKKIVCMLKRHDIVSDGAGGKVCQRCGTVIEQSVSATPAGPDKMLADLANEADWSAPRTIIVACKDLRSCERVAKRFHYIACAAGLSPQRTGPAEVGIATCLYRFSTRPIRHGSDRGRKVKVVEFNE